MATGNAPSPPGGKPVKTRAATLSSSEQSRTLTDLGATAVGITLLQAADAPAQRTALGVSATTTTLIYRGLLTQTSTGAPTVAVLENTLSAAIVWARTSTGLYTGTLVAAFTTAKTFMLLGPIGANVPTLVRTSADVVTLTTKDLTGTVQDVLLSSTAIQILVFP